MLNLTINIGLSADGEYIQIPTKDLSDLLALAKHRKESHELAPVHNFEEDIEELNTEQDDLLVYLSGNEISASEEIINEEESADELPLVERVEDSTTALETSYTIDEQEEKPSTSAFSGYSIGEKRIFGESESFTDGSNSATRPIKLEVKPPESGLLS